MVVVTSSRARPAVIAHRADALGYAQIGGDHGTGITERPQVLAGVEAEAADSAETSRTDASPRRPVCLGRVLDQHQAMTGRESPEGVHVGELTEQVHGHD